MIDIRKLKELVRLMVENDLTEMDLRDSQEQVTLHRPSPNEPPRMIFPAGAMTGGAAMGAHTTHGAAASGAPAPRTRASTASTSASSQEDSSNTGGEASADESGLTSIDSPMVGTFYTAQNPENPPFVSVGSRVTPDTVVCLVEAMKIFNEIKAECSGTVRKVLIKNGQAVEFGQKLFLIEEDA